MANVNLGMSGRAGQAECLPPKPCDVWANYRSEHDVSTWMHELMHVLEYRGDMGAEDPLHDREGLMGAVVDAGDLTPAHVAHLRALAAY